MPHSPVEGIAFLVGLALVATVALLLVLRIGDYGIRQAEVAPATTAVGGSPSQKPTRAHRPQRPQKPASKPAAPVAPKTPVTKPTAQATAAPKLVLTAARGDCWVEMHAGSQQGKTVYLGILKQGQTVTFPAKRLWIRLGAPEKLDATLGGRPTTIPRGTGNVIVTETGIRPAPR